MLQFAYHLLNRARCTLSREYGDIKEESRSLTYWRYCEGIFLLCDGVMSKSLGPTAYTLRASAKRVGLRAIEIALTLLTIVSL